MYLFSYANEFRRDTHAPKYLLIPTAAQIPFVDIQEYARRSSRMENETFCLPLDNGRERSQLDAMIWRNVVSMHTTTTMTTDDDEMPLAWQQQ